MPPTSLEQIIPELRDAIGPVILISGVGLLLLTFTNRLGRAIDRARQLNSELPNRTGPEREQLRAQITIIYRRAKMIRLSITWAALSALLAAALISRCSWRRCCSGNTACSWACCSSAAWFRCSRRSSRSFATSTCRCSRSSWNWKATRNRRPAAPFDPSERVVPNIQTPVQQKELAKFAAAVNVRHSPDKCFIRKIVILFLK